MKRALFVMPTPRRFQPTPGQLALMDTIAMQDGLPLADLPMQSRPILRRLIAAELVQCLALGPARYSLTPVGRLVRGRGR